MAYRQVGQASFADALVSRRGKGSSVLRRICELVDWAAVECVLRSLAEPERGAPPYPRLVMFKALLLQQWYGLSDPELEEALDDRASFREFCGFVLGDETPDHTTIWRFREALQQADLEERLFGEILRQIDARGLVLRRGTLIDASLIPAAVKPPKPPKDPLPLGPDGRAPSKLVNSERDADARWTKKGGKRYFGYKAHVGVDQGSAIIRRSKLTDAAVNDTVPADELICGDEKAVYADQAYDKHERRALLAARGIKPRLMFRPQQASSPDRASEALQRRRGTAPRPGRAGLRAPQGRLWLGARSLSGLGTQSDPSASSLPRHEPQTMGNAASNGCCAVTAAPQCRQSAAQTKLSTPARPQKPRKKMPDTGLHPRTPDCAKPSQAGEGAQVLRGYSADLTTRKDSSDERGGG
ncbi:IS5 family transposase [Bradyrhizobium elkanii]|uniref:IS5 family transposase n=1 Tax=Bradyrhizobium elkanii TaxID=29448 RepID=UPI003F735B4C